MTVIAFKPRGNRPHWRPAEVAQIVEAVAPRRGTELAGRWEVGTTEIGEPQFYLLGPPPDEECVLCISRLGHLYVLENGAGQVLFEHNSLVVLAQQAKTVLLKKKSQIVARVGVLWCAARELFEEKLEPIAGESEELIAHIVPQLAAFA
jgi:hypothetical protein